MAFQELFNIEVPLWQWVVSQVFGVFALVGAIICWQLKDKRKNLIWITLVRGMALMMVAFLENWILVAFLAANVFRGITMLLLERNREDIHPIRSVCILFFFISLTTVAMLLTMEGSWLDWLLLGTAVFVVFGEWSKSIHLMRTSQIFNASAMLTSYLMIRNIMGVAIEGFNLISLFVFYIIFFFRGRFRPKM